MTSPSFRMIIFAFLISLIIGLGLLALMSAEPLEMLKAFITKPFTNPLYRGNMLEQAGLILLAALGFSITFRSGMFNLGGEGQIAAGALSASLFAAFMPQVPFPISVLAGGLVAFIVSGIVGVIIAVLKQKIQISELISSFLLSLGIVPVVDFLVAGPLRDSASQALAMPKVPANYFLQALLPPSRLSFGAIGSLFAAFLTWLVIRHSLFGFDTRTIASNLEYSKSQGIPVFRRIVSGFALGAGFHGLVGATMVYGSWQTTYVSMGAGIGWAGISAALLARAHPIGAIFGSLILAFLDTGTRAAMIHSTMSLEIGGLMQGIFFLFLTVSSLRKNRA